MKKGRSDEREDGLIADKPFNSETMRTVKSSGDGWESKSWEEKTLERARDIDLR